MSAELVPVTHIGQAVRTTPENSLVAWAREADAAYEIAQKLAETAFCPAQFRGKPIEAAAAILAGSEVGLSPTAALRSFDIIQGTAAPRALTLRAVAQAHGAEFLTVSETDQKVVMRARRLGATDWEEVTWTIEQANRLGLTKKDNWLKQPKSMLVARATAELARRVAADAILGIGYSVEELDDDAPPARATVRRNKPVAEPTELPALPDEPAPERPAAARVNRRGGRAIEEAETVELPPMPAVEDVVEDAVDHGPDRMTDAQRGKLHATFNDLGMTDRRARLQFAGDVIGRPIESSNELTKAEATQVIEELVHALELERRAEEAGVAAVGTEFDQPPLPGEDQ